MPALRAAPIASVAFGPRRDPRAAHQPDPRGQAHQGLSFAAIADALDLDRVWTTAALLGQHPFDAESSDRLVELLELPGDAEASALLQEIPTRGSFDELPPTDPTVYRFYEVLQVYGPAIKALIGEDFGDGIMSAINFKLALERVEHPDGDRVRVTLEGKFLPYAW